MKTKTPKAEEVREKIDTFILNLCQTGSLGLYDNLAIIQSLLIEYHITLFGEEGAAEKYYRIADNLATNAKSKGLI